MDWTESIRFKVNVASTRTAPAINAAVLGGIRGFERQAHRRSALMNVNVGLV